MYEVRFPDYRILKREVLKAAFEILENCDPVEILSFLVSINLIFVGY